MALLVTPETDIRQSGNVSVECVSCGGAVTMSASVAARVLPGLDRVHQCPPVVLGV